MPHTTFDDPDLRSAMAAYLSAARLLDEAAARGGEQRDLMDLAEAKVVAGLTLRKRLEGQGWVAPARQRSSA